VLRNDEIDRPQASGVHRDFVVHHHAHGVEHGGDVSPAFAGAVKLFYAAVPVTRSSLALYTMRVMVDDESR